MTALTRISISLEEKLLREFDRHSRREGYPTRSEAVKALIRRALAENEWAEDRGTAAGTLVIVYDHHKHDLLHQLMHVQHDYGDVIISSQHVHLDHDNCMETITVRGASARLRELTAALKTVKGLKHQALVMAASGPAMP
jgi:CopG family nickel-responsive transcriptional regulator